MNGLYREEHPLLCEDLSDEELYSPRFSRRIRSIGYRGRARYNIKGAAAIIRRWPGYWASVATYWWIGLGMITLTTFIIYNSLFAFTMLPFVDSELPRAQSNTKGNIHEKPAVFMHIFVNNSEQIDVNKYVSYIEIFSKTYRDFNYNIIVVVNDTFTNQLEMSAEENNEFAMNSLWTTNGAVNPKILPNINNINIEHTTLSKYLNNSPLRKQWRNLPHQFIEFLVKAVSIWDKGGIAFNPIILTPHSPHKAYLEKVQNILKKCNKSSKINVNYSHDPKKIFIGKQEQVKNRVNNIRDIIDALKEENISTEYNDHNLIEAEDIENIFMSNSDRKFISADKEIKVDETRVNDTVKTKTKFDFLNKNQSDNLNKKYSKRGLVTDNANNKTKPTEIVENNTSKFNLLPLFMEFLFHKNPKLRELDKNNGNITYNTRERKSIETRMKNNLNSTTILSTDISDTREVDKKYKPMIIAAKGINYSTVNNLDAENVFYDKCKSIDQLTIDLKGYILATDTPCHAFLGTVFSNAIHHDSNQTLTDFIITELSIFCKGLLSVCKGIDLILL